MAEGQAADFHQQGPRGLVASALGLLQPHDEITQLNVGRHTAWAGRGVVSDAGCFAISGRLHTVPVRMTNFAFRQIDPDHVDVLRQIVR